MYVSICFIPVNCYMCHFRSHSSWISSTGTSFISGHSSCHNIFICDRHSYNVMLSYRDSEWSVDALEKLPQQLHPQISVEELIECEVVVKNDPLVQKLAADVGKFFFLCFGLHSLDADSVHLGVAPDQIFCDGWSIGHDERFPQERRVQQALVFARFSEHDNLYAHPFVCSLGLYFLRRPFIIQCNRTLCLSSTLTERRSFISVSYAFVFWLPQG